MAQQKKKIRGGSGPYRKGADFEREVAEWYRQKDCLVTRQPKSQSPYDLHVTKPLPEYGKFGHYVALVQCKLGGKLPKAEKEVLLELASHYGAVPILAYKKEGKIVVQVIEKDR